MEKAIKFSYVDQINKFNLASIDRFYFGQEFCERILPSPDRLKIVIQKVRTYNKKFSFLTPPVTEHGLNRIRTLINLLHKKDEIVINDFGVLNMINEKYENPIVIGRIFGRHILHALNVIGKSKNLATEYIALFGPKVEFIETDYFNAYRVNNFLNRIINFSLRTEPFFWTITRRCAFNNNINRLEKFADCNKECLECKAIIKNTVVDKKFLLEGNKIINVSVSSKGTIDYRLFKRIVLNAEAK